MNGERRCEYTGILRVWFHVTLCGEVEVCIMQEFNASLKCFVTWRIYILILFVFRCRR